MKKIVLLMLAISFFACGEKKEENKEKNTSTEEKIVDTKSDTTQEELQIIVGKYERKNIEASPYGEAWFNDNYELHPLDETTASALSEFLKDVEIKVFMGTWCSDSQMQVPAFFKIMDKVGFDESKLTLIAMTEDKTTIANFEEGLNITNVPTFIFYKDGEELNRIVEAPIETLEKDMLAILKGEEYKHTYAE
ncbi:thioredoxin family protein [Sungkyunkwania multivorans]|uniref:Thioredoxin family protein n=1 Tax=Sungkyunkwania multivorans TaxID=1173618 RepID=A0ABW3CZB3_9FLAO